MQDWSWDRTLTTVSSLAALGALIYLAIFQHNDQATVAVIALASPTATHTAVTFLRPRTQPQPPA
jgi:ABC-type Fe3+-siderophore transport system permease subunit